jgi:outer membrane protein assembly factor BamE
MYRSLLLVVAGLLAQSLLIGCTALNKSTVVEKIKNIDIATPNLVYKVDIVQGNFVSREQVAALRVGMPKLQVKNILGTALLNDVFHADRWDYIFTIEQRSKAPEPRKLAVFFKDNLLDRWEGDNLPSEVEFVQSLSSGRKLGKTPQLEATEQQLRDFAKRENPAPSTPTAVPPAPQPNKAYPALESK